MVVVETSILRGDFFADEGGSELPGWKFFAFDASIAFFNLSAFGLRARAWVRSKVGGFLRALEQLEHRLASFGAQFVQVRLAMEQGQLRPHFCIAEQRQQGSTRAGLDLHGDVFLHFLLP